jgi:hypothetical protein
MTLQKKNAIIVFAFTALMMAMPFATGTVFAEEMDANLNSVCGFTTSSAGSVNFGSFNADADAATVGEEDVVLPPLVGSTASARVQLTFADWFGTGTLATGTLTLLGMAATETVVVGSETYTAVSGAAGANEFDIDGNDIADATNLAAVIRATDAANFKVSTAGTAVVTIDSVVRGTAGNSLTLTGDTGATASGATLAGGSATPQLIMDGETTKFTTSIVAAQDTTYAAKTAITTLGTSQEVLGGTNPAANIHLALMIDPASATFSNLPYDGPLTQTITITVEAACDGT